ncbi:MAG: PD-(D/E)XK nuclease family transposase, partial [Spirochaetaceae bacterium]|nr:PD-(D/E)XK nuclease family transposase [Spirochaetaceae bacterium]
KLADWLRFLKAETEEEFKMVAEKNPMIHEAYCKLQAMSDNEANRMIYEARLKAQRDDYSRIQGALRKGLEEGRAEGRAEGRKEGRAEGRKEGEARGRQKGREEGRVGIILQMAQHGMGVKDIAAITHLSEQEVGGILKQGNA